MSTPDPNIITLKDKTSFGVRSSPFRGYARIDGDDRLISDVRRVVAEGGGLGPSGAEALSILKRAGAEEPSWPAPGDPLDDLAKAVVELRRAIVELRDDHPLAPGERPGRAYVSPRAWGFRHAGLCGWASRMGMVDDPKYSASPLLAEAIALRAELQRLADETRPKTDYYRGDL